MSNTVNHPKHYGGESNPYEAIKIIEAWYLGFHLGNVIKYILRPTKGDYLEDLKKARWYLDRKITQMEQRIEDEFEIEVKKNVLGNVTPGSSRLSEGRGNSDS